MELFSSTAEDTFRAAKNFATNLKMGDVVLLQGDLGAGKTVFAKGVAACFGIDADNVLSPTFVLMRTYASQPPLVHCDLYRLGSAREAEEAGILEALTDGKSVALVEWGDSIAESLAGMRCFTIKIEKTGATSRTIKISEGLQGNERSI